MNLPQACKALSITWQRGPIDTNDHVPRRRANNGQGKVATGFDGKRKAAQMPSLVPMFTGNRPNAIIFG